MAFASDLIVNLGPVLPVLPFGELLEEWKRSGFHTRRCAEVLRRVLEQHPEAAPAFDVDAITSGGHVLRPAARRLSSPRRSPWSLSIVRPRLGLESAQELPSARLEEVAKLIRLAAAEVPWRTCREQLSQRTDADWTDLLVRPASGMREAGPRWGTLRADCLQRREHGAVALRTRKGLLLVDPYGLDGSWKTGNGRAPRPRPEADAVLVTHLTAFHLPSVIGSVRDARARVITPQVGAAALQNPHLFRTELDLLGQRVDDLSWGATVRLAGAEVEVLPFYGWQASTEPPSLPRSARGMGNCYRVEVEGRSIVFLSSSGIDADGSMVEVLAQSAKASGPIDVLVGPLFSWPSYFHPSLPQLPLFLPFARLQSLAAEYRGRMPPSMTLGVEGMVGACAAAGAAVFLPSGHGFSGVGRRAPGSAAASEVAMLDALTSGLQSAGVRTHVVRWKPGDTFSLPKLRS